MYLDQLMVCTCLNRFTFQLDQTPIYYFFLKINALVWLYQSELEKKMYKPFLFKQELRQDQNKQLYLKSHLTLLTKRALSYTLNRLCALTRITASPPPALLLWGRWARVWISVLEQTLGFQSCFNLKHSRGSIKPIQAQTQHYQGNSVEWVNTLWL